LDNGQDTGKAVEDVDRLERARTALTVVSGLNLQQKVFTLRLLMGDKPTEAARYAGYKSPEKQGPRLAKNPKVTAVLDQYHHGYAMTIAETEIRLSQQGRALYADFIKPVPKSKEVYVDLRGLLRAGLGHLIKKINWDKHGNQVVEFYDAQTALVNIARIHGMFKDNLNLDLDLSRLSDEELNALDDAL
jgi:hypothetical protein